MVKKENLNAVDLAKFICSILVVTIHIAPLGTATTNVTKCLNFIFQDWLGPIAVPFFFICSGFFLYRKTTWDDFNSEPSKKYILRILRLYLVWTAIYFPFILRDILKSENVYHSILILIRNTIVAGSYVHLWYLSALIVAVFITSFLLSQKVKPYNIICTAAVLYFLGLLGQSWFGFIVPLKEKIPCIWDFLKLTENIMVTTRNGLFEGFLFVAIGMYLAYFDIKIEKQKAFIAFIFSMFLLLFEIIVLHLWGFVRADSMYLCLIPTAYFAFCYIKQVELAEHPIYKIMRVLSSLIYYIHMWICSVVVLCFTLIYEPLRNTPLVFVLTMVGSCICSYAIYVLSNRKNFEWVKRLYV